MTEEERLRAVGGAAGGCGLFTEDDLLGAMGGAARSFEHRVSGTIVARQMLHASINA